MIAGSSVESAGKMDLKDVTCAGSGRIASLPHVKKQEEADETNGSR
jgi:hypothetical protein